MDLPKRAIVALVVVGVLAVALFAVLLDDGGESNDSAKTQADSTSSNGPGAPTGGGNSQAEDQSGGGQAAAKQYTPPPGTPAAEVYTSVDDFYGVIAATDRNRGQQGPVANSDKAVDKLVARVCNMMSRAALKELQASSPALDEDPKFACKQSVGLHFGRVARSGGLAKSANPTITNVKVDGSRALVTVDFPNSRPRTLRMVQEDGDWKLDASPVGG